MGFSLSRALGGALIGASGTAAHLAEQGLKEEAKQRELAAQFEKQKELIAIQDENTRNRDQSAYDFKVKREKERADRFGEFLSSTIAEMKKEGIKPFSIDGQARISEALASKGYVAEADKYSDNAKGLAQIKSNEELRKAEQAIRLEMARDRRGATSDKESTKAAEKRLNDTIDGFSFELRGRDGSKQGVDDTAADEVRRIVDRQLRSGKSHDEINSSLMNFKSAFNAERASNPSAPGSALFRSTWEKIKPQEPPATTSGSAPPASENTQKRAHIAGVLEDKIDPANFDSRAPANWKPFDFVEQTPSEYKNVGSKPMRPNFGDGVVDAFSSSANVLTGQGASWNQVGGDIGKPRSAR